MVKGAKCLKFEKNEIKKKLQNLWIWQQVREQDKRFHNIWYERKQKEIANIKAVRKYLGVTDTSKNWFKKQKDNAPKITIKNRKLMQ